MAASHRSTGRRLICVSHSQALTACSVSGPVNVLRKIVRLRDSRLKSWLWRRPTVVRAPSK